MSIPCSWLSWGCPWSFHIAFLSCLLSETFWVVWSTSEVRLNSSRYHSLFSLWWTTPSGWTLMKLFLTFVCRSVFSFLFTVLFVVRVMLYMFLHTFGSVFISESLTVSNSMFMVYISSTWLFSQSSLKSFCFLAPKTKRLFFFLFVF